MCNISFVHLSSTTVPYGVFTVELRALCLATKKCPDTRYVIYTRYYLCWHTATRVDWVCRRQPTWNRIPYIWLWINFTSTASQKRLIDIWEGFPKRHIRPPFLIPFVFAYYSMCGMPVTSVMPLWFHYRTPKVRLMSAKTNFTSG